jgi:hypothetical protein
MRGKILRAVLFSLTALGTAAPASASLITGHWMDGFWNCKIDGRYAKMAWSIVDASEVSCTGNWCTSAALVRRKGRFAENGSRAVPLYNLRDGSKGRGAYFDHADGNRWWLGKPVGGVSTGYTTWQGKRYPLVCSK